MINKIVDSDYLVIDSLIVSVFVQFDESDVSRCAVFLSFVWINGGETGRSWPQSAPSAATSRT